ncbi:hypothetical protein FF38_07267 [Lucilia cuprina]|uniref:Uncharacterized protein n=1 Tax=Lucilia cuprina TaxID=7375 RepID=A0A0L0CGB0_LUCCU|nr:hypothetical protein FF38_07267 [Lucilia cuprina]
MGISPGVGVTIVEVILLLLLQLAAVVFVILAFVVFVLLLLAVVEVGGVGVRLRLFLSFTLNFSVTCGAVEVEGMLSLVVLSLLMLSLDFVASFICGLSLSTVLTFTCFKFCCSCSFKFSLKPNLIITELQGNSITNFDTLGILGAPATLILRLFKRKRSSSCPAVTEAAPILRRFCTLPGLIASSLAGISSSPSDKVIIASVISDFGESKSSKAITSLSSSSKSSFSSSSSSSSSSSGISITNFWEVSFSSSSSSSSSSSLCSS